MRLVVPSWLVPGGWLENLEAAVRLGWAEGMELLCFSFEGEDRELLISERPGIEGLLGASGLSLSVHLPDPLRPEHSELVGMFASRAEAFILHPPRAEGLEAWADTVSLLRREHGDRFLLEYTDGRLFEAVESALPGLPLCADTGRLLLEGIDPASWIAQRAGRVREIHLHGAAPGNGADGAPEAGPRDHRVFSGDEAWLAALLPLLASYQGRIELELFSLAKVEAARAVLEKLASPKEQR
jgi:sugar phosphate isomerase/epimerase